MFKSKTNLMHGTIEFNRLQELIRNEFWDVIDRLTYSYGIVKNQLTGNDVWAVTKTGDNAVEIAAGKGIILDADGNPRAIELEADYAINDIPAVDGTYKVLLKHSEHNYETGTVSLANGSATVNGTNTEFSKIFDAGRRIIIGTNILLIQEVVSDTELTLTEAYAGTSIVSQQFSVGGWFVSYPEEIADNKIYTHDGFSIIVTTEAKGTDEYWLAEIVVSGGVIDTITDKRDENVFILHRSYSYSVQQGHTYAIPGVINVEDGTSNYVIAFPVRTPSGQTAKLIGIDYMLQSGDDITIKVVKGTEFPLSDVTGLTDITVSTTPASTDLVTPIALADHEWIAIVVTAIGVNPSYNLSVTPFIEYTVA